MEFLLLWWDDLDDITHACRHLVTTAFSELARIAGAASALAKRPLAAEPVGPQRLKSLRSLRCAS